MESPPEFTSLLTFVEQIILGVHEKRCCNHDVPQRFYTADDVSRGRKRRLAYTLFFEREDQKRKQKRKLVREARVRDGTVASVEK